MTITWIYFNTHGKSLGEMYTSVMSIKQSSLSEIQLIHYLRTYIDHETRRLEDVKRFYVKVSEFHDKIYSELAYSMANPLVAFSLIKRLQSEWLNVVYSSQAKENLEALRTNFESLESSLPRLEDLQGAAQGLMRLQDVYALHVEALVKGHFQRNTNGNTVEIYKPSVTIPLSGDDCFLVGKVAYEAEDYYHAVQWLEEAVSLFGGSNWSLEHDGSLEEALDHLAFSHYKTGNISSALSLSLELLHHDPSNKRVLLNLEKYKKLLTENPPIVTPGSLLKRPNTTYLRTRDTYERLCQTHGSQLYEDPQLFCDYFTNDSPGLYLQPIRREVLSLLPYVVLFHNFVMGTEAQSIRDSAVPGLRRSVVASGVNQTSADYRISKSAWLKDSTHPVVGKVNRRITLLTGLNVQHPYGEHLQVVNYGIGGHYEPHYDHATSKSSPLYTLNSGNRMATFMIYLSSVEAGGSTAFIHANLSVPAVEAAASSANANSANGAIGAANGACAEPTIGQRPLIIMESDVRRVFKRVNTRKAAGPNGICSKVHKACTDQLAPVFTDIFNLSLTLGIAPSTIVPKKPQPSGLNNYCPVALTSVVMKCFEKLVRDFITSSLLASMDPLQFAYRHNRSTDDAVAHLLHTTLTHLDKGRANYVKMLFVDYSSAFNTIIPSLLTTKLEDLGLHPSLCDWISNFLTDRPQSVQNSALFWWNLHRNGQGDGDTLHAGCPVLLGDKWVANKWVHEYGQEFQRRCSRDPDE
ncbi:hypothetical protein P4O66_017563 [Electrophorus voltai]|uniref:Prolyl 4-hydroxylase alpha subunit domain-containing protein n=1 Tax=Electrophorus voltai TaxID=2609070 RepID=A0AAD8YU34_9TELE|nr:hypothetical protein P4O66_017563 [Electrophorus voltai]